MKNKLFELEYINCKGLFFINEYWYYKNNKLNYINNYLSNTTDYINKIRTINYLISGITITIKNEK